MLDRLERTSQSVLFFVALLLTAAIGYLDYRLGYEEASALFYFLPIFLASWRGRGWGGYSIACAAAAGSWLADRAAGHVYERSWVAAWNAGLQLAVFLIMAALFVAMGEILRRERALARTDPLTGVSNPRHFEEVLGQEISRCSRTGAHFTLAYLDLDDFKSVNDTFGHSAGDHLLAAVAGALAGGVRNIDTVARLGGDEFALLFPECDEEESAAVLERIRRAVGSAVASGPRPASFSMGAVTFYRVPRDADEAVRAVDDLMYEVKRSGKASIKTDVWKT